jgi:hypothetical protein
VDFTGLVLKADLAARLSAAVCSAASAAPAPLIFDFTVGDLLACGHENLAPGGARRGGVLGWLPAWFDGGRGLGFERAAWTRFCKPLLAFAFTGRYVDEDESDPSEVGQGLGLAINKFSPQPASLFFGAPLDKSATREELHFLSGCLPKGDPALRAAACMRRAGLVAARKGAMPCVMDFSTAWARLKRPRPSCRCAAPKWVLHRGPALFPTRPWRASRESFTSPSSAKRSPFLVPTARAPPWSPRT